ncbi:hypothetical protein LXL04_010879 [Taraxacum kok-saghyz]
MVYYFVAGPLSFNFDNAPENITISLSPYSWTKMANVIYVDIPAGTGFSYGTTKEASISSDSILVKQSIEFIQKGYILCSPLTDKFTDFNSRLEYAHRTALISDDIYNGAIGNCHGDYRNTNSANAVCRDSLQRYEEYYYYYLSEEWINNKVVQEALGVRQGTIGKWEFWNQTIQYAERKNDTFCYAYDIFSSVPHHKKLVIKNCRGPRTYLTIRYEMTYAQNEFSLTFATVKGAGHSVPQYKPKESMYLAEKWLASKTYSSAM